MPLSSRDRVKEPNPDLSSENSKPLEQRPARSKTRDPVGLIKSTRSSLTRGISSSRSVRASPIESYIRSPSSSRTKGVPKKTIDSTSTGQRVDNPTFIPDTDSGTSSETSYSSKSNKGTTNKVTMSSGRLPPFVRDKVNKTECEPTSCGIRQKVIAQLNHMELPKEKVYSQTDVTEIFLHNIWRDKFLQISALCMGMHTLFEKTIESDADKEYSSLIDALVVSLDSMWAVTRKHIVTTMLDADYGTLAKIKGHKDRTAAALEAAQTYTNGLAMVIGNIQRGAWKGDLQWPSMLDSAVLGPDKKLTIEGIKKLLENNNMWGLVPVCDAACTTDPKCDPRGEATPAERDARIDRLEAELFRLNNHVTGTIEVRQELQTVKIAANCASKASTVVELLETQLKIGNLEASVHGFSKGNSKPENLKLVMTHLENLKLSIRLSNVSGEVIQPNKNAKQFSPFCILNFATQGFKYQAEGELSRARKGGKTKMTCTRPTPKYDLNDLKKEEDVRKEIIGYFESTLVDQGKKDWCLSDEGRKLAIATLRISKRHAKSPTFSLFY